MFKHYAKIAWRNLLKYKTQSVISILGLTVGVVFFAYGYHWYKFETTYDSFYPDSDRIYQIYGIDKFSGKQHEFGEIPYVAVEKIKNDFPEIEEIAVQYQNYGSGFKYNDKDLGNPKFEFVDEHFFRLFPPKVIVGKIHENTMKNGDEMIITESFAQKHFSSNEKAIGKTIISNYGDTYVIEAVIADPPTNSIFRKEGYLPDKYGRGFLESINDRDKWENYNGVSLYIKLHEKIDVNIFQDKLSNYAIDRRYNENLLFEITPLKSIRHVIQKPDQSIHFDIKYIRTFILSAILLLFSSFFNYLNILINILLSRHREMNLRRITGADRKSIYLQIAIEISLTIVIISLLSFWIVEISKGLFENTFSTEISTLRIYSILLCNIFILNLLLFTSTGIFLFRFIQKTLLLQSGIKKNRFRINKISLGSQLIISLFFMMSAFVFYRQVNFMNHNNWGFDYHNLLQIKMSISDRDPLMNEIKKLPMVENIIKTGFFHIEHNMEDLVYSRCDGVEWNGKPENYNPLFQSFGVEKNFIEDMGFFLLAGRDFKEEDYFTKYGYVGNKAIINETAQRVMGMDNPIGNKVIIPSRWFSPEGREKEEFEIIGIVKDFHSVGLRSEIPPLIIRTEPHRDSGFFNYVHITPGSEQEAIEAINHLILKYYPGQIDKMVVKSMNSILLDLGKTEQETMKLFLTVAILCIMIAIFGIYSVSQRETQRRRKEIAIRKTAGAKSREITSMFFRDYLTLTLISALIGLPLSWLFMEQWLQNFAYRISISWWMFVVVLLVVATIVILTIVTQVSRAANQNPAEVVKSE